MSTRRMTTAQALVQFLSQQYLEDDGETQRLFAGMFGIFGHGNVNGIGQALESSSAPLRFIQGKSEQGMVHAAVAYAKATRRRQIWACTASIGPGALNMVTGAAVATVNRLPVLLLPGDIFSDRLPDPVLQQLEHPSNGTFSVNDAFVPVSRYWDRIARPSQLMSALNRAMTVLTDPADTGAVTLALPQDVQTEAWAFPADWLEPKTYHLERRSLEPSVLAAVVQRIRQSARPVLIIGGGARYSGASRALTDLAEQCHIPLVETQAGKGVVAGDHPWNLGAVGVTGTQVANRIVAQADLILAVGTRLTDFTTASHTAVSPEAQWIGLNCNRQDAYKMGALAAVADVRAGLIQWVDALAAIGYCAAYAPAQVAAAKASWHDEVTRLVADSGAQPLSQLAVLGAINRVLTERDVIVAAAGGLPGDLHRLWQSPGHDSYHVEYGFSCMGYEIAGALGQALATPDRRVWALVGDGSYLMLHSELVTAVQERVSFTAIVFDNGGYQCIRSLAQQHGGQGQGNAFEFGSASPGREPSALPLDFAKNAESLGAIGVRVESLADLETAMAQSRNQVRPTVIQIAVDPSSSSEAYDAWWRVDVAEGSSDPVVERAYQDGRARRESGRRYVGP